MGVRRISKRILKQEASVNMSLPEVIENMGEFNVVDSIVILKKIYGISYIKIAKIFQIQSNEITRAVKYGTFDGLVREDKIQVGIRRLQRYYLHC